MIAGSIDGAGTLASSGTLSNGVDIEAGSIVADPQFGSGLTLSPAVYQQGTFGGIFAGTGAIGYPSVPTLDLEPTTGPGGFRNLVNGTLTGGIYAALAGTLELPGTVSELEAGVELAAGPFSAIEAGGTTIEASLTTIGPLGGLLLDSYNYVTANTLTVEQGTIGPGGELGAGRIELGGDVILSPAELILAGFSTQLGGAGTVTSNIENDGGIFAIGQLVLSGTVTGTGTLRIEPSAASTLELGQANSEALTFDGSGQLGSSVLRLDDPRSYSGTITGFTAVGEHIGNAIDLPGFAPGTLTDIYSGTTAGGVLDILAPGSVVASLTFVGDYTADSFKLVGDGHGGTYIELVVPCFARGTRIAAPAGEVAVEDLRVGDRVLTADGEARPIVWIGERRVDCARHRRPWLVHPVRIRAGAFADGAPKRDLLLSPDHALFCDDALIPVQQLINGATIRQEKVGRVHYFHIELDRHTVVLAEGLPAESYLNTGNRGQFENGGDAIRLFADFATGAEDNGCAPRLTRGAIVDAVCRRLWQRAVKLGAQAKTPELRVEAGGRTIRAAAIKGRLYRFLLPAGAEEARIVASTGVRVGAMLVNGRIVPLDGPALGAGFGPLHQAGAERWRAIDQAARLRLPEPRGGKGAVLLELLLQESQPIRRHSAAPRDAARFGAAA